MKAIIAVNNLGFIGLNNNLPWQSKLDLHHFKQMTKGNDVRMLVGFNTYQTLPKVVKSRGVTLDIKEATLRPTYPKMTMEGNFIYIPYICVGGKKTYEKYCHLFTELHISHINDNTIGDTLFPDLTNLNPNCKIFNYHFEVD